MVENRRFKLGRRLLLILDEAKQKPSACLWFYVSEGDIWRLFIAYKKSGAVVTSEIYRKFIENYGGSEVVKEIGLENITIMYDDDGFLTFLRSAINTNSEIRFKSNVINGILVDDSYIYRL